MAEDRSEKNPTLGEERRPFLEKHKAKLRLLAAGGILGAAAIAADVSETGVGGGIEFRNPLTGENHVASIALGNAKADLAGIPKELQNELFREKNKPKVFKVQIGGDAITVVIGERKTHLGDPQFAIFMSKDKAP